MDSDDREPEIVVTIDDDVPDEQHESIKASVQEMARRSSARALAAVERNRADAELARRMSGPFKDMVEAHADAAAALDSVETATNSLGAPTAPPAPDWPNVTLVPGDPASPLQNFTANQAFGTPYHYQWAWHGGHPPVISTQDRQTGRITLYTHSDQNNNWGHAHGGFGIGLTSDRTQQAAGRSLRRVSWSYRVHGGSFGGDATAEGGTEMTAMEGNTTLSSASDKRFRRRVSAGESDEYSEPGWETGEAIQVDWVMLPGHHYNLNVGGWVFAEAHGGLGTASYGSPIVNAQIILLTVDVTD